MFQARESWVYNVDYHISFKRVIQPSNIDDDSFAWN